MHGFRRGILIVALAVVGWSGCEVNVGTSDQKDDDALQRTVEVMRQQRDSLATPLTVRIMFGVGDLNVRPAAPGILYTVKSIGRPETGILPRVAYDSASHRLDLGDTGIVTHSGEDAGEDLNVELSPHVPLDLELHIGVTDATLTLGGLDLRRCEIQAGASDINLDLRGQWTHDVTLQLESSIADVHVHIPANVAVVTNMKAVLSDVDTSGFHNPSTPAHHLYLEGSTAIGDLHVERD